MEDYKGMLQIATFFNLLLYIDMKHCLVGLVAAYRRKKSSGLGKESTKLNPLLVEKQENKVKVKNDNKVNV